MENWLKKEELNSDDEKNNKLNDERKRNKLSRMQTKARAVKVVKKEEIRFQHFLS